MALSNQVQSAFTSLDLILAQPVAETPLVAGAAAGSSYSDADGLISFANLSSSFVSTSSQFTTGQTVCDKVANFFATMRLRVFTYLQANPTKVLAGDKPPVTQWDASVINFMRNMLVDAGGFSTFQLIEETYSQTQTVVEFSTAMFKMIFDTVVLPESIVVNATKFIQGVGDTLRFSWDKKSKSYMTCLVGICHEAVQTDSSGTNFVYFPKIKYYYISIDTTQAEFTSPCVNVKNLTFNLKYDYYVTSLKASVLDPTTDDYKNFVAFLDKAQDIQYKAADNTLDAVLAVTSSAPANVGGANAFGASFADYPKVSVPGAVIAQ